MPKRFPLRAFAICLGLCGVLALALVPVAWADGMLNAAQAPAALRNYPSGAAPCNTTLQACISGSNPGDVINIAANTYITGLLVITRALTIQGAGPGPANTMLLPDGSHGIFMVPPGVAAGVVISNLSVFSGTAISGGGIDTGAGSPLTLWNVQVMSNTATNGGGIFAGAAVTLTNVSLVNNKANALGGGLRANTTALVSGGRAERNSAVNGGGAIQANGALVLSGVTIISNTSTSTAFNGGGVRADGSLLMLGALVQGNVSGNDGGGISASSAVISASQIISNTGDNGGGVFVTGALSVTDTLFNKNVARAGSGGSIFSADSGITITLAGSSSPSKTLVSNSTALTNGGGIFVAGGAHLLGYLTFSSNKALNGEGGAIYAGDKVDDNFPNTVTKLWTGNTAAGNGGAIRALGNVNMCMGPAFQNNSAGGGTTANGGAIYADGSIFLCNEPFTPSQNNTAKNGGAFYAKDTVVLNGHDVFNSIAVENGGCVYSEKAVTFNVADARGCVAGLNGGAAYSPFTVTITAAGIAQYSQNKAGNSGGLAFGSVVIVHAASVVSNSAPIGGAVVATRTLDIADSTFISNTAATLGGAASVSGNALITNSLFATNRVTATNGIGGALWVTGTAAITNSTFLTNASTLNTGAQGGAVGASGRLSLLGDAFQGNQATTGGAVRGLADVFATNTSFTGNGGVNDRLGGGIAALTVTVSSVTMTQNTVCCTNAFGGAISATVATIDHSVFIQNSAYISGGAVIAGQVFISDSQFLSNTLLGGEGGAVWTRGGVISTTQFTANSTNCCSGAAGGAVFAQGQLSIYGSQFTSNQSDRGGALMLHGSSFEVHDSTFTNNFIACCGGGAAIDAVALSPAIYHSTFSGNHVDCCDGGGAIRSADFLDVESSTFSNNSALADGGAIKRLVAGSNTTIITASTFISNFAGTSGGAVFGKQVDIENSTFISNHVASLASGGALALFGFSFIGGDSFTDNRVDVPVGACSSGLGGAIFQDQSGSITLQNSAFARNSSPRGGALFTGGGGTIEQSSFNDNSALCLDSVTLSNIGSGGAVDSRGFLSVKRSSFVHNSAGSVGGGGIAFLPASASTLHVENSLFARNVATNTVFGAEGAGIVISASVTTAQLFFNTFTDQPRNPVSAIVIYTGTVSIVDNIITGHANGIKRLGGTAFEDFNLFFDNGLDTSGGVTSGGSGPPDGDPLFVAPGADNYHIQFNSPAKDAGSDLGVTVDFDGDVRPIGPKVDIGFDERPFLNLNNFLYLPLIMR